MDLLSLTRSTGLLDYFQRTKEGFEEIGATPFRVLERAGSLSLREYLSPVEKKRKPILILPSFINRSFVLDLLPEKSFVKYFLDQGHDVYMIDWGVPEVHEQWMTLEELLAGYLDLFLKKIELQRPGESLHLVGHCLGGTLSLILASQYSEKFLSLTLITTPVQFTDDDKLSLWARSPRFDVESFVEAHGNVPWVLLQSTFLALRPTQGFSKIRSLFKKRKDKDFLRNFIAMETWSNDNVDLRGLCFKSLLLDFYRDNKLAEGKLKIHGKSVDLSQLQIPTFVLIAKNDHIVSAGSHLQPKHMSALSQIKIVEAEGGHIGALLGGASRKSIWPQMRDWMASLET